MVRGLVRDPWVTERSEQRERSPRISDSFYLSPAQDSGTHVRSVEFFCHSRARVWRARGIPNSAGGRGEGPGFFARQPRARMAEQKIEQDRNCHYDLQSLNSGQARVATFQPTPGKVIEPSKSVSTKVRPDTMSTTFVPGPPRSTVTVKGLSVPAPTPVTVAVPVRTAVSPSMVAPVIGPVTYMIFLSKMPLPCVPADGVGMSARQSKWPEPSSKLNPSPEAK